MIELDKETKRIMNMFKTIRNRQEIADILADRAMYIGRKYNNSVLSHFYGEDEPVFITESCISFGLMNFMEEDFFVVKEVLGYDYIMDLLDKQDRFLRVI